MVSDKRRLSGLTRPALGVVLGLVVLAASPLVASAQEAPPAAPAPVATDPPASSPGSPQSPAGYNEPLKPATTAVSPEERARIDDSPRGADGHPLAGYHNGLFYLRDHHDNFHLYIQGRAQLDFFSYLGAGVPDTALKPTLFIRRVRPEVTGEFLGHWRFMIAGDFGATALDNPRGTNETAASAPGVAPASSTSRYATAETTRFQAAATDVFINYRAASVFNVEVGQMDAPFTMENKTSDKYLPFMERSLAVRAVGIPSNKEIGGMFWGETRSRFFYYSAGVYNGDGQNRPNVDSRFDVISRVVVHPLAGSNAVTSAIKDMQVGASFHYGSRDQKWVQYDYPVMTTQGAYAFWTPTYAGSNGMVHIIPAGDQISAAGELRLPIDRFDVTSEVVYIDNDTREAVEGFQAVRSERFGNIHGVSYYAMLGFWAFGQRDVNGVPGYGNPPRLDWSTSDPEIPPQALQLLAKWEQVSLKYDSASRGGAPDPKNADGDIKVNAFSVGANYWATRHVRLSLNYVYDRFPDSAPVAPSEPGGRSQTSKNRAQAPGNTLPVGTDSRGRESAHDLHEILARIAVAL
jgi:phosphate-selective porin